ncbi:hypothetical protein OJ997_06535 [Solirubrobacter phytolaccae]|uniref:Uncharacterized protein n=1 Tax=Solirubrobacter phytolaccae TaxID=1404360 RepID=A0A9X3S6H8_9ACTN|nr:hypothetical protein [Solirubrobacter phytolaccae]MDA0179944.1 hypothetical protein [Solirubrobacter phytolaccae]
MFVLDFVREPSIIVEQGKRNGITQNYISEISAWCAELNEQLKRLAAEHGIELQVMGGNATSLRLDAAAQRGSSDNDYLTSASEAEVEALMAALRERFADLGDERMSSAGKTALPLVSYTLSVPSLTIGNRETIEAKVEFISRTSFHPPDPPGREERSGPGDVRRPGNDLDRHVPRPTRTDAKLDNPRSGKEHDRRISERRPTSVWRTPRTTMPLARAQYLAVSRLRDCDAHASRTGRVRTADRRAAFAAWTNVW